MVVVVADLLIIILIVIVVVIELVVELVELVERRTSRVTSGVRAGNGPHRHQLGPLRTTRSRFDTLAGER